ncbi:MAG: PhoX family protein [Chitinophagaceae bacterium]|nr:PhoX family protein [Chitinophagaceae bacterium]
MYTKKLYTRVGAAALALSLLACKKNENSGKWPVIPVLNANSATPSMIRALPEGGNLLMYPLISSEDVLTESPSFVYGAQPDGAAFFRNPEGKGYIMLNNHEITQSVSRVYLDEDLKPTKGEYIVDAEGGRWRLCSATMATPAEHGFGPLFLTAGESGEESMVHGITANASVNDRKVKDRVLPALGKASMENAVPLPKQAFPGKTIVIVGEDQSPSTSHQSAGQISMYLSNSVGDLESGKFYQLARVNRDPVETNMVRGNAYDVEFVEIPNAKNMTGKQINEATAAANAIRFARVEDVDYRKGSASNNREIYFVATGVSSNRIDPVPGFTMWGRLYKLVLDAANPLKGKLEVVMDGSVNPGKDVVNPDNVCATENFVYVQEDSDSYYVNNTHDAYIWQFDCRSNNYKAVITMEHRRDDNAFNSKYNPSNDRRLGTWEFGAMLDISDIVNLPNTFMINIHPHTWTNDKFRNPDGSGLISNREGGQTIIVRGLPR